MNKETNKPDFFIVGAPKSGTTALDYHLNLHPEIFMAKKEIHYFGSDIGITQEKLSEKEYLYSFNDSESSQIKGESSVWYLYSKNAAEEIKAFNPKSKIIILLRNPVEMIPSLHSQYIYNSIESEENLTIALNNDIKRTDNNEILSCSHFKERPPYINTVKYFNQVQRYLDTFSKENVLILLHEELTNDFDLAYKKTLIFLGIIKTDFSPTTEQVNSRKSIKSIKLHQISKNPSTKLKRFIQFIIPFKIIRHNLMKNIDIINIREKEITTIPKELKEKIIKLTFNDVGNLAQLIKKDLSSWLR
ncbi:MAG: hypothetical protein COA97_08230 [Flavobacteriales bacterium]|nr:MAG: hypothetical protein COA97_08230 [Flavobacteriales bacterium]